MTNDELNPNDEIRNAAAVRSPRSVIRASTFIRHSSFVIRHLVSFLTVIVLLTSCSGSKLTLANYNKVTPGMSKAQVERILGPPTSVEKIDMFIFKKTTYRYEDGKKFAIITFKNDEVDSKDTNLNTNP